MEALVLNVYSTLSQPHCVSRICRRFGLDVTEKGREQQVDTNGEGSLLLLIRTHKHSSSAYMYSGLEGTYHHRREYGRERYFWV